MAQINDIQYPNRIDTVELAKIKNTFALRDRANSENSAQISRDRSSPTVIFDNLSTPESLGQGTLRGLKYPLELDSNGGITLSSGYDRIGQAIHEVFDTRIGERIGNPFMGIRELLFETISEETEAQTIKRQLLAAIPYLSEESLSVTLSLGEDGTCYITAIYSVEGSGNIMVRYNFRAGS